MTGSDVDATGASAGFAVMHRVVGETATERIERFWLFGNIVFLNEDRTVALYVELLSGTAGERKTVAEALASVRTVPLGLRWMGGIVPSGADLRARVRKIEHELATRYRRLVPEAGWVQVPFYDRNNALRMSDTKIKLALQSPVPAHRTPRPLKLRPEVKSHRTGGWRATRAQAMTSPADGWVSIGVRNFVAKRNDDGYVYLTVHGGVEPTYRLKAEDYTTLEKGKGSNV